MENFLTIYGRFNCVTSRVKVLAKVGWLKKKEEEDEQFWISTVLCRPS